MTKAHFSAALVVIAAACSPAPDESAALVAAAQEAVRLELRDPDSAQFSDLRAYPERRAVCGQVNARNGFGGYVGRTLFAYTEGTAALATEPGFPSKHAVCLEALSAQTDAITAKTRADVAVMNQADPQVREILNDLNAAESGAR